MQTRAARTFIFFCKNIYVKVTCNVSLFLATLLKSILCVSRTTAAYKFCRENKTFKVETEFYFGEVSSALLDDVCDKPRRLGTVATPFSSLSVTVFCRHIKQIENLVSNQRQKSSLVNSANEPTVQNQRNLSAADKLASDSSTEFQPPRKVGLSLNCYLCLFGLSWQMFGKIILGSDKIGGKTATI